MSILGLAISLRRVFSDKFEHLVRGTQLVTIVPRSKKTGLGYRLRGECYVLYSWPKAPDERRPQSHLPSNLIGGRIPSPELVNYFVTLTVHGAQRICDLIRERPEVFLTLSVLRMRR
jgi:hypothetical protein